MKQITTWDNNPRELWVEDKRGKLTKKFIVFYNISEGYGLDKCGNRYLVCYEPTELEDCKTYEDFKCELIHTLDNKNIDLTEVLSLVGNWFEHSFLPIYKDQVEKEIKTSFITKLRELYAKYDTTDMLNNRFRFSPQEHLLAKDFCSNIEDMLNSFK